MAPPRTFWILLAALLILLAPRLSMAQGWGEESGNEWGEEDPSGWGELPPAEEEEEPEAGPAAEPDRSSETSQPKEPSPEEIKIDLVFSDRKGLALEAPGFRLGIHTLLQTDLWLFETGDYQSNTFLFRRAYVGVSGTFDEWLRWKVEYDLADTSGTIAQGLQDTFIEGIVEGTPLAVRAGYFKPAVTAEEFRVSTRFITFLERSSHVTDLFPGRRPGLMVELRSSWEKKGPPRVRGWLGVHNGNAGPFVNFNNDWGLSLMAEAVPVMTKTMFLQAGVSTWLAYHENLNTWTANSPEGAVRFVDAYDAGGLEQIHGFHVHFHFDRFAAMFEYTFGIQQRKVEVLFPTQRWENYAPLRASGYHLDFCVMLWAPEGKPRRNVGFNRGLEVCARFERLEMNNINRGTAARLPDSPATNAVNLLGGRMGACTLGVNWYITRRARAGFNMITEWFELESDGNLYVLERDHQPRTGGPRFVWALRFQVFL